MTGPTILVLQHDSSDPLLRMQSWLVEAGAVLTVLRPFAGDQVPADLSGFDAVISLGGAMGALDDERAPWLPATRHLLATAVHQQVPTLGICLGSQLLAAATGGSVTVGDRGPEIGAYLTAKRDAAESDPLFAATPMTPDVMQYHYDVVSRLPPGAVLLMTGTGYPHQAWRIGERAWGIQFHIEPAAEDLRVWAKGEGRDPSAMPRLGPALDEAAENIAVVWREFTHRFVALAAADDSRDSMVGKRIPLIGSAGTGSGG